MHISQDLILSFLKLLLFYADLLHKVILRVLWDQKLKLRKSSFFLSWHIISSGVCPAAYTEFFQSRKAYYFVCFPCAVYTLQLVTLSKCVLCNWKLIIPREVLVLGTCNKETEVLWVIQQREDEKQRWEWREEEKIKGDVCSEWCCYSL